MTVRARCVLVLPALAAGVLALPAGAAQAPATQALDGGSPVALTVAADGRLTHTATVQGALTATRRHADTRAWLTGMAAAVQAAAGPSGRPAPLLWAQAEDDEIRTEPVEAVLGVALAGAGGDLDGDGRDDVLSLRGDAEDLTLQARRGTDGRLLWSSGLADGDGALAYPLGVDLTGDGAHDLLSHVVTGVETVAVDEGPDRSTYRYTARLVHTITAHSGRDGRPVWSHQVQATVDESATSSSGPGGVTYDEEYALTSTALAVLPLLTDDLTADGLPDVVLNEIDLDVEVTASGVDAEVAGAGTYESSVRSATRAVGLSGADGTASLRLASPRQAAVAVAVPVGDVVASPAGDVAWTSEVVRDVSVVCAGAAVAGSCVGGSSDPGQVGLEVVDGATGQPAWATTAEGTFPFAVPLGADTDGDGAGELALLVATADGGRLAVLSGRSGRLLWETEGAFPFPVGVAAQTDGRLVALVADLGAEFSFEPDGRTATTARAVVSRHDAADGEVLSTRTHESTASTQSGPGGSQGFAALALQRASDGDGDGRPELVVGTGVEVAGLDAGGQPSSSDARSAGGVEDLATGAEVLAETSDDVRLLLPLGDLDGDGLSDLQRVVFGDDPFGAVQLTAFRTVDRAELWQVTGRVFDAPQVAGDHDGRPGLELVLVDGADGAAPHVASLRGADLQERWRAPARG